jgi:putative ABC transport system permease protein
MRIRELAGRLRDRLRRDQLSAELDEELRHHRDLLARNNAGSRRSLGNVTYYREEARAMWTLGLVDDLLHDVRYAARVRRRDTGFTAAVVLTLALGIGANTAVFSIVNTVLLRELPYADPSRLVSVWTAPSGTPSDRNPTSLPDIRDWQQQAPVFSGLAGFAFNRFDADGPQGPSQVRGVLGTGNLYEVLGAKPVIGRLPRVDEERSPVVAISYRVWQEQYGGSPSVVGRMLEMNGQPYTIVGVMPRGFHFPSPDFDVWTTLYSITSLPDAKGELPWVTSRSLRGYRVVARLAPNVTMTQAEGAMNQVEHRLGQTYPTIDSGIDIHLQSLRDDTVGKVQRALWTVFGAASLILLLSCVNVAHLLLVRLASRGRELAVRRALGAHRGRVMRQLATESVLLALIGGAVGIAVAFVAMRALMRFSPGDIPRLENVAIDGQTLAFALLISLVTGLLFGVAPALLGWGGGVHDALRAQGKGAASGIHGGRTRATLTTLEVAFAVVLLIGAGLMLRSFTTLTSTSLGIHPEGVTVAQLTMIGPRYQSDGAKIRALESVLENLRTMPGVTAVGASTSMPPSRMQEATAFEFTGKPRAQPGHERMAIYIPATPGFVEALRIPVRRGRAFDRRDGSSAPLTAVVSDELVRRHFTNVDPIGQGIDVDGVTRTIVGVVGDAVYEGVGAPMEPVIYVPFAQQTFPGMWIAIRSARSARELAAPVRNAIRRVDPGFSTRLPVALESMVAESVVRPRFNAWLLSTFGGLALVLASVGIYSVIAYAVTQRRSEIGIRLALGAPARSVVTMFLRSGMIPVVIGILIGLAASYAGSRLVAGLLYGIAPTDGVTFGGVTIVLSVAALAAAYVPARRAARVDPLAAIRSD